MNKEINEGPFNTLGTSIKSGLAKRRDTALGGFGGAQERLGLRVAADQNVKTWVNWLTRQRYGGGKVEGNADDLRRFIQQVYGDHALQAVEPTIKQVAGNTPPAGSQHIPAPPGTPPAVASTATPPAALPGAAPGSSPAAASPSTAPGASLSAAPVANATPTAPFTPAAAAPGASPAAAAPGVTAPVANAASAAKAPRAPRAPKAPVNPEVPDWLAKQRNSQWTQDNPPPMDIPPSPRDRPNPPPAKTSGARGRPVPIPPSGQYYKPTAPRESVQVSGKLVEVALQRSQIDKVMQRLATVQADSKDAHSRHVAAPGPAPGQVPSAQPNQVANTQPQGQAPAQGQQSQGQAQQPQGQPAANGQQRQQAGSRISASQILGAQVSAQGLKRSNANLTPVDKGRIDNALGNGSMSLEELLDQLPELKGATVVGLLKALEHSS